MVGYMVFILHMFYKYKIYMNGNMSVMNVKFNFYKIKELTLILLVLLIVLIMMKDIYYYLSLLILMEFVHVVFLFLLVGYGTSIWVFTTFLVYSVCEGILGLLILISMNNEFGHQKMKFLNLMI